MENSQNKISNYTWFKTGGEAEEILKPKSVEELVEFIKHNKRPYNNFYQI